MLSLLLFAYAATDLLGKVVSKKCSNIVAARTCRLKYLLFFTLMGIIACAVFFVTGGFRVSFTPKTFLFAAVFSLVSILSVFCHMEMLKLANISGSVVLSSFGSLIATSAVGFFIFDESVSVRTLLKIALMSVPSLLTFIDSKRKSVRTEEKSGATLKLAVLVLLIIIAGCGSTVTVKTYSTASGVADINSMFFWTNALLVLGALPVLLRSVLKLRSDAKDSADIKEALSILRPLPLTVIFVNTTISNVSTLIGANLIKLMDVSLYTPISAAIGILAGVVASFIYRERHELTFYLSAVFALIAVII